jgi:steroid delta-isomerase-like uncharacterized protein
MDRIPPVELVRQHLLAEDNGDVEATLATFTEDCYYQIPALGIDIRGKDAIRAHYEDLLHHRFPDLKNVNPRIYDAGTSVFAEAEAPRTHIATWMGVPATGRFIEITTLARFPIAADGLLEAEIIYLDVPGLLYQFGLIEEPTALAITRRLLYQGSVT